MTIKTQYRYKQWQDLDCLLIWRSMEKPLPTTSRQDPSCPMHRNHVCCLLCTTCNWAQMSHRVHDRVATYYVDWWDQSKTPPKHANFVSHREKRKMVRSDMSVITCFEPIQTGKKWERETFFTWGSVWYAQSIGVIWSVAAARGISDRIDSEPPASNSNTFQCGFSDKRLAMTAPADPPPTRTWQLRHWLNKYHLTARCSRTNHVITESLYMFISCAMSWPCLLLVILMQ